MDFKDISKELFVIILASLILGFSFSIPNASATTSSVIFFFVIIILNTLAKKITAFYFSANTKTGFWSLYQTGFTKKSHLKYPIPLFWIPLLLSFISRGFILWLAIIEFDITPRPERAAKRHGLYRFTEMTDFDVAVIASSGIVVLLIVAVLAYLLASAAPGLETLARLSVFYAFWSLVPLGKLDGSKILFGSRVLWFILLVISAIFLTYALVAI